MNPTIIITVSPKLYNSLNTTYLISQQKCNFLLWLHIWLFWQLLPSISTLCQFLWKALLFPLLLLPVRLTAPPLQLQLLLKIPYIHQLPSIAPKYFLPPITVLKTLPILSLQVKFKTSPSLASSGKLSKVPSRAQVPFLLVLVLSAVTKTTNFKIIEKTYLITKLP